MVTRQGEVETMVPIVSVIIPAYNREKTIGKSIHSVLRQTFSNFEIIVVDDGSKDRTRQIVTEIEDKRVTLISHDTNQGAAAARNTGMRKARGKYIAWLDSDDEWLPEKLLHQIHALGSSEPNQKACISAYFIEEQKQVRTYFPRIPDRKLLFLGCDLSPGTTLVFERIILDTIGYLDESLPRYEDWDWLLTYSKHYNFIGVDEPLALIHYSPHRSARNMEIAVLSFLSKHNDTLINFGWFGRKAIARRWIEVARYYAQENNWYKTALFLSKSLLAYPFHSLGAWLLFFDACAGTRLGQKLEAFKSKKQLVDNRNPD